MDTHGETYWNELSPGFDSIISLTPPQCAWPSTSRCCVELRGTGYDFFVADAPYGSLQVQVILTAATGTIEFVYGADHDLELIGPEGLTTTIGVENADGSIGLPAGLPPTGGTSILFTPSS